MEHLDEVVVLGTAGVFLVLTCSPRALYWLGSGRNIPDFVWRIVAYGSRPTAPIAFGEGASYVFAAALGLSGVVVVPLYEGSRLGTLAGVVAALQIIVVCFWGVLLSRWR